jgi:hypothetical protein
VVEHRKQGEEEWREGYVTSLEPLKVTTDLSKGPSARGLSIFQEVRAVSAARQAQLDAMRELAARISVGAVVERRRKGEEEWREGYVTSLEPLLVTLHLSDGPSGNSYIFDEVRAVPAARQAELDSA